MTKDNKKSSKKDLIIEIILVIIIILLLLHSCSLRKGKKQTGNVNIIDITCDSNKCKRTDSLVNCLNDESNSKCIVPDFTGKTKEDVLKWLNSISTIIDIEYKSVESSEKDGTVLEQSVSGISIKELLDSKNKLVITIANNGSLIDCLNDENNGKCFVPNFTGKTKKDVDNWLNTLANHVNVNYNYKNSNAKPGTILSQSVQGKKVKDVISDGDVIIIVIATNNNQNPVVNPGGSGNNVQPGGEDIVEPDGDFYVDDSNVRWSDETDVKIFTDSLYNIEGRIAPESLNTYKFVVNNETKYNLKYKISFAEENQYNINLKYKLKKNGSYLVDHYVSYDELNIDNLLLNSKSKDTYLLEWKWVSSDNDTQIGVKARSIDVNYNLKIKVEAESV